jgi:homoserine dehydrogenase
MKTIKVSIIGFGAVGRTVADVILRKASYLERIGVEIKIVAIVDLWGALVDPSGIDRNALKIEEGIVEMTGLEVIREVDHDVMIETTPTDIKTGEPGLGHMMTALEYGRNIVTSNKGPLALKYKRLMDLARKKGVKLRFEASVGGAMPLINLITENLAGNEILSIKGIFNGTCNYILGRMTEDGLPYEHALSEARELKIAEADPSYDVDGIDTACKLVILANEVFGMDATYKDVDVTGIREVTPESLKLAYDCGYTIKLIGEVERLKVSPKLVPKGHPLDIGGILNAASIRTDLAGEITVVGKGAGPIEAASSIFSDLIHTS